VAILYRRQPAPVRRAAGLVDERAEANDRFITLSTIDQSGASASLVRRLRTEALGFIDRVQLKRDFPYRVKRSFYYSFLASVTLAMLFRLAVPLVQATLHPPSAAERLRALAERMAERPALAPLARQIQALAKTVENPKIPPQEKQAAIQTTQKTIAQEQAREEQRENRDMLGEAASTVKGMDQQAGNGQEHKQDQNAGAGDINSNLPQEGQQKNQPSAGSGAAKGEMDAQPSEKVQQGQAAKGDTKQQSRESNQQTQGEGKPNQPDSNDAGREKNQETAGKTQGNREDKGGKSKASEEIPQSAPPAERFNRPGEGKEGIKGAGYVTVQLPEEAAAEGKGERGGTTDSKGNRVGQKLPVSNVPLPAHLPDAPSEKQQVPLEYRGMIR
jgi:hypothetical protein